MKLGLSYEGALQLRNWSNVICGVESDLQAALERLDASYELVHDDLGEYTVIFDNYMRVCSAEISTISDSLLYLKQRLSLTANQIEDYIGKRTSGRIRAISAKPVLENSVYSIVGDTDDGMTVETEESGVTVGAGELVSDKVKIGYDVAQEDSETADTGKDAEISENDSLSKEEKAEIELESGWSNEIVDSMRSMEEYKIYKKAGLKESEVCGKKCLICDDIDWGQKDEYGRTNYQRVEENLSPMNTKGEKIYLHHIGQKTDSPTAELNFSQHRQNGNDIILHDKKMSSEVHGDGTAWPTEKNHYWKCRSREAEDMK